MRLYTFQLVCRLDGDDKPDLEVDIDVEDGVPANVVTKALSAHLRGVADQLEQSPEKTQVVERQ